MHPPSPSCRKLDEKIEVTHMKSKKCTLVLSLVLDSIVYSSKQDADLVHFDSFGSRLEAPQKLVNEHLKVQYTHLST